MKAFPADGSTSNSNASCSCSNCSFIDIFLNIEGAATDSLMMKVVINFVKTRKEKSKLVPGSFAMLSLW